MTALTIACVWTGDKYPLTYVKRLRNMVHRNLEGPFRFICLTDHKITPVVAGVEFVDISLLKLPGWWAKMALFDPLIRGPGRCVYFDLDTVVVSSLQPLADYSGDFAICQNFTRLAGNTKWPCDYGSCVMSFPDDWGSVIYSRFINNAPAMMRRCPRGDQQAIEQLYKGAVYLQDVCPPGFFVGRRDFSHGELPPGASVMIFAGKNKPQGSTLWWVRDHWK